MNEKTLAEFVATFGQSAGLIEGGDGTCVELVAYYPANRGTAAFAAEFGCKERDEALLVDYVPVGKAPDMDHWVTFPSQFKGYKVYYRRGLRMVPQ